MINLQNIFKVDTEADNKEDVLFSVRPDSRILWYLIFIYTIKLVIMLPIFALAIIYIYSRNTLNSPIILDLIVNYWYFYLIFFSFIIVIICYFIFKETIKNQIFYFTKDRCILYTGLFLTKRNVIFYLDIDNALTYWPLLLMAAQLGYMLINTKNVKNKNILYGLTLDDVKKISAVIKQGNDKAFVGFY